MREIAFIDLEGHSCHWTAADHGNYVIGACGTKRESLRIVRVEAFGPSGHVRVCAACEASGQPDTIETAQPTRISRAAYAAASEAHRGVCLACERLTTAGVEPNALDVVCDGCGTRAAYGVKAALRLEFIEIVENEKGGDS